jgi:hypothetical protein
MIALKIDTRQLVRLQRSVAAINKSLPRELSAVVNKVAKRTQSSISKEIRKELTVSAGQLKKQNQRQAQGIGWKSICGCWIGLRKQAWAAVL